MAKYQTKLNSDITSFEFEDENGEIFAHAKLKIASVHLLERLSKFQQEIGAIKPPDGEPTDETVLKLEDDVETVFCTFFGYDVKQDLFGAVGAVDILGDGRMWCQALMETITDALEPEMNRLSAARQSAVKKYTEKYE